MRIPGPMVEAYVKEVAEKNVLKDKMDHWRTLVMESEFL
jgi:hypothetical protein